MGPYIGKNGSNLRPPWLPPGQRQGQGYAQGGAGQGQGGLGKEVPGKGKVVEVVRHRVVAVSRGKAVARGKGKVKEGAGVGKGKAAKSKAEGVLATIRGRSLRIRVSRNARRPNHLRSCSRRLGCGLPSATFQRNRTATTTTRWRRCCRTAATRRSSCCSMKALPTFFLRKRWQHSSAFTSFSPSRRTQNNR